MRLWILLAVAAACSGCRAGMSVAAGASPGAGTRSQEAAAQSAREEQEAAQSKSAVPAATPAAKQPAAQRPAPEGPGGKSFESSFSSSSTQAWDEGGAQEAGRDQPATAGASQGCARAKSLPEAGLDLPRRPFRLSPNRPQGGEASAAVSPVVGPSVAASMPAPWSGSPPSLAQLEADMSGSLKLETMLMGAYHIQLSTSPDFARPLFDKTYDFMEEDPDVYGDIEALSLQYGNYWARYTFIDLLGLPHPFSAPRPYSYRPRRSASPETSRSPGDGAAISPARSGNL